MKLLLLLVSLVGLSACQTTPTVPPLEKPEVVYVTKIEYVIRIPPKELLTVPEQVKPINIDAAKQSDIARWILANEERTLELERLIQQIAAFFDSEQKKLQQK
jgi:hypothetical protein